MTGREDAASWRAAAGMFCCLLLTVCTAHTPVATGWVKTGADDATITRELQDCNSQARA